VFNPKCQYDFVWSMLDLIFEEERTPMSRDWVEGRNRMEQASGAHG
jgi:hypothetical protein